MRIAKTGRSFVIAFTPPGLTILRSKWNQPYSNPASSPAVIIIVRLSRVIKYSPWHGGESVKGWRLKMSDASWGAVAITASAASYLTSRSNVWLISLPWWGTWTAFKYGLSQVPSTLEGSQQEEKWWGGVISWRVFIIHPHVHTCMVIVGGNENKEIYYKNSLWDYDNYFSHDGSYF